MEILTIDDLERASQQEIQETMAKLSVAQDLRQYLEWLVREGPDITVDLQFSRRNRSKSIHPSTVSHIGFCPLRAYYECTGELESIPTLDFETVMTFDIGTALHGILQTHLRAMFDDQFQDEVKLQYPALYIDGSADGLFSFSFARAVLEIKSIKEGGAFGWEKVQERPLPDHPRQIMCYQRALDAPFGIILYICKNNSKIKEHIFPFNPLVWLEIESETRPIVQAIYEGGAAVTPKPGSNCFYCPFSTGCRHAKRRKHEHKSTRDIKSIRL